MNLAEFLLARIAEDEAVAAAAVSRRDGVDKWEAVGSGTVVGPGYDKVKHVMLPSSEDGAARHIARHDPARVLAECEAKRQVVHEWQTFGKLADPSVQPSTDEEFRVRAAAVGIRQGLARALSHLAMPYADHLDYRQEWKP